MSSKSKPTKKDLAWQKKIEKRIKLEGVELNNPKGRELFEKVVKKGLNRQ